MPFPIQPQDDWLTTKAFLVRYEETLSPLFRAVFTSNGSLTQFFEGVRRSPVEVRLESQSLLPLPFPAEDATLWSSEQPLPPGDEVLSRNAWLTVGGVEMLFAHSEVVVAGLHQATRQAIERGEEPLGAVFSRQAGRGVVRRHLELTRAQSPALSQRLCLPFDHLYWCRRSVLTVANQSRGRILEIFFRDFT